MRCRRTSRSSAGLSPRGRGNPFRGIALEPFRGSIPALGGGTPSPARQALVEEGLSPRGRGNRGDVHLRRAVAGSIPAWAGEPRRRPSPPRRRRVYPRVGGGTLGGVAFSLFGGGLSPRRRGNPVQGRFEFGQSGSIPAWAGEPGGRTRSRRRARVYPRVGGGTGESPAKSRASVGLSPRGRGNRRARRPGGPGGGSIPAWAGEPRIHTLHRRRGRVYPRVGGGTTGRASPAASIRGLSPRGRGNPARSAAAASDSGSIPAWAGEPRSPCRFSA